MARCEAYPNQQFALQFESSFGILARPGTSLAAAKGEVFVQSRHGDSSFAPP